MPAFEEVDRPRVSSQPTKAKQDNMMPYTSESEAGSGLQSGEQRSAPSAATEMLAPCWECTASRAIAEFGAITRNTTHACQSHIWGPALPQPLPASLVGRCVDAQPPVFGYSWRRKSIAPRGRQSHERAVTYFERRERA